MSARHCILYTVGITCAVLYSAAAFCQQAGRADGEPSRQPGGALDSRQLPGPSGNASNPEDVLPQQVRMPRAWSIEPRILLRETWTDNVDQRDNAVARGDWITELSPGIAVRGMGARTNLDLDYQFNEIYHARSGIGQEHQNFLRAAAAYEVIDDRLFLESRARIAQQTVSALALQPSTGLGDNANRAETRAFEIGPHLQGRLGGIAQYDLRYTWAVFRTNLATGFDNDQRTLSGNIGSAPDRVGVGWNAEYMNQQNQFSDRGDTRYRLYRGTIGYRADSELRVFGRGGRETNDFFPSNESDTTYGVGVQWSPTPRTQLTATTDHRYFGNSHLYEVTHRWARLGLRLAFVRDARTTYEEVSQIAGSAAIQRLMDVLSSSIPDPLLRADKARQLLASSGIVDPSNVQGGFLSSQIYLDTRAEMSAAWTGSRNTIGLTTYRTESRPLMPLLGTDGDFLLVSSIKQNGVRLDWSSIFGPTSTLGVSADWRRNKGNGASDVRTNYAAFNAMLIHRLGISSTLDFGYRFARSTDDVGAGYRENRFFVAVTHRF